MNPTRRPLHKIFILFSIITCFAAFAMAIGQIVGIVFQQVGPVQYILRLYVIALCLLATLVELECTKFTRDSLIFGIWITRGLFYAFIGVLGLEENDTSSAKNTDIKGFDISRQYVYIVAWVMIVCGFLYSFMGIACLQIVHGKLQTDYEVRLARAPEVRRTMESYTDAPESTV